MVPRNNMFSEWVTEFLHLKSSECQSCFEKMTSLYTWAIPGRIIYRGNSIFAEIRFRVRYWALQLRSLGKFRVSLYRRTRPHTLGRSSKVAFFQQRGESKCLGERFWTPPFSWCVFVCSLPTRLEVQSRFGDKPHKFQVVCPPLSPKRACGPKRVKACFGENLVWKLVPVYVARFSKAKTSLDSPTTTDFLLELSL